MVASEADALGLRFHEEFTVKRATEPAYRNLAFGGVTHSYGRLVRPGVPYGHHMHQVELPELITRNSPTGRNHVLIGRMVVVTIYQYWDDHTRKRLEDALSLPRDTLKEPVFGDLRRFRGAIIHNQSRSQVGLADYEVFRWFDKDQTLDFRKDHIEKIVDRVLTFVQDFPSKTMTQTRDIAGHPID